MIWLCEHFRFGKTVRRINTLWSSERSGCAEAVWRREVIRFGECGGHGEVFRVSELVRRSELFWPYERVRLSTCWSWCETASAFNTLHSSRTLVKTHITEHKVRFKTFQALVWCITRFAAVTALPALITVFKVSGITAPQAFWFSRTLQTAFHDRTSGLAQITRNESQNDEGS